MGKSQGGASKPSPEVERELLAQIGSLPSGSEHEEEVHREPPLQDKINAPLNQSGRNNEIPERNTMHIEVPKVTSNTWKPIAAERPRVELPGHRVNGRIHYMRDHALIGKFIWFWPTKKALHGWISAKWKPKGHVTLQLGPKGFFTMIFLCIEDRNWVIDEVPYCFNFVGLYLREWAAGFNPDKEDLS